MIRDYKPEDLPMVKEIANLAWRGIYDVLREQLTEELFRIITPDPQTAKGEQLEKHTTRSPDQILICEEDGKVVGFVTFFFDEERGIGEIGNNAVDPRCGLKGIGQQMYAATLQRFRERGMKYAQVTTGLDPAHAPARRAYERAGFNIKKEWVTYYRKLEE